MPKYRIISEIDPCAEHRAPRGCRQAPETGVTLERLATVAEADNIIELLGDIEHGLSATDDAHRKRRVISVEEVHPGFSFTDEQITEALSKPEGDWTDQPMIDPEEFSAGESIYASGDFIWTVHGVAEVLRESGLVPGLHISLLMGGEDYVDYSMIEIHDDARMIYLSRGCELKHLTDDRSATGWQGVLAIARELISLSNDLH